MPKNDDSTSLGTGTLKAGTLQDLAPEYDVAASFDIDIQRVPNRKLIQVTLTFATPENLAGVQYAQFTLPHYHAGKMARMLEGVRKKIGG
jgi:hypothetical protein